MRSFTDETVNVRERVRAMREHVGLTRVEMARRAGVSKDAAQKWETTGCSLREDGQRNLLKFLAVLCKADETSLRTRMQRVRTAVGVSPHRASAMAGLHRHGWARVEQQNKSSLLRPDLREKIVAQLEKWEAELGGNS